MTKILDDSMKFDKLFRLTTTAMRINGSHPSMPRDKTWRRIFFTFLIIVAMCLVFLLHSLLLHDIQKGKFEDASKNLTMVIVAITILYKYWILLNLHESVTGLIEIIDEDYELAKDFSEDEQRIVLKYATQGVRVCQFWTVSACGASAGFPLKAFFLMGKSYFADEFHLVPLFDVVYPWFIEEYKYNPFMFIVLFCMTLIFGIYASSMYVGFDPLIPIFMLHFCGQIEILSSRISKVFMNTNNSDETVRDELRDIISGLQHIYKSIETIETNFVTLYEFTMKTTTFLLSLSAFQIAQFLRRGEVNVEFIGFLIACILHFFSPCYYSDLLMETGEKFRQTLYSCGWENRWEPRTRRTILFMMTRATKPLVISTIFCAVCLDTFAKMSRDAYSMFNLMNTAWT